MFRKLKNKIEEEAGKSPVNRLLSGASPSKGESDSPSHTPPASVNAASPATPLARKPAIWSAGTPRRLDQTPTKSDKAPAADGSMRSAALDLLSSLTALKGSNSYMLPPHKMRASDVDSDAEHSAQSTPQPEKPLPRTESRESINSLAGMFQSLPFGRKNRDAPSDAESDLDSEASFSLRTMNKEELYRRFKEMEKMMTAYRGKYNEMASAYRDQEKEKEKIKNTLTEAQDKSLRRISEMREAAALDQQAKRHLEEEFRFNLEEKDELIGVLQTQVRLLKQGNLENAAEGSANAKGDGDTVDSAELSKTNVILKEKVRRLEDLLNKCKDMIKNNKERTAQLTSEKEKLATELESKAQVVQQLQEWKDKEQVRLDGQLQDARHLIEQLESSTKSSRALSSQHQDLLQNLEAKDKEIKLLKTELRAQKIELGKSSGGEKGRDKEVSELKARLKELEQNNKTNGSVEQSSGGLESASALEEQLLQKDQEWQAKLSAREQELQQQLEAKGQLLETQRAEWEARLAELATKKDKQLQDVLGSKESEIEEITSNLETMGKQQLESLTQKHEAELQETIDTIQQWETRQKEQEEAHKKELEDLTQKFRAKLEQFRDQHNTTVAQLKEAHQKELTERGTEMTQLRENHQKELAGLQGALEGKGSEVAEQVTQYQQRVQELETRIQQVRMR
ncbi:golgin subfamily A member 4-like [Branchiostoma floridae]|uniref:Golgin subfamily A member 4-like n=1 Tax=Branchiostoma floridae TaxID=7739 RepID=A0A9J7LUQ2_BRAFL|nr:golgin subfamily A member 4-like [Branchiostoma floridae]